MGAVTRSCLKACSNTPKIGAVFLAAALMAASSGSPADAWYRHGGYYAPYYRPYARYYSRPDPGAAIALGLFSAFMGAAIASQGGGYPYYGGYYNAPAYSYTPGPCPQWWDGVTWEYSCN
jgi:hypothetical protein